MTPKSKKNYEPRKPRTPRKITPTYLQNSGMYYLERFAASKAHFITVMTRKIRKSCAFHDDQNFDDCVAMLHTVADKFVELDLLNDEAYTQGMIASLRRGGRSERFILGKLREKGIAFDFAKPYLQALDAARDDHSESAELQAARRYAKAKRLGAYARPPREGDDLDKIYKRHLGAFARAGFSYAIAKQVLGEEIY